MSATEDVVEVEEEMDASPSPAPAPLSPSPPPARGRGRVSWQGQLSRMSILYSSRIS